MTHPIIRHGRSIALASLVLFLLALTGCAEEAEENVAPPDVVSSPPVEEPVVTEPPDLPQPAPTRPASPPPTPLPTPEEPTAAEQSPPFPNSLPSPAPYPQAEAPPAESPPAQAPPGPTEDYPTFPWPPPRPSASYELHADLFAGASTYGNLDDRLKDALTTCGYVERAYFAAPEGFALVTRLEQINPDGTSKRPPDRWSTGRIPLRRFSLTAYLRALFRANPGYYRVIAFVVTPHPFTRDGPPITIEGVQAFFREGANTLHPALGALAYTDRVVVTALVYEFERPEGEDPRAAASLLTDSLEKTGILAALTP